MKNKSVNKKAKPMTKKRKITISVASVCTAAVLALSIGLPIALCKPKYTPFHAPELSLPIEEEFALTKYSYDELKDVQTTLRTDAMNVTQRNLPRTTPEILSDDFSLVYNKNENRLYPYYGDYQVKNAAVESVAKISFNPNNYPQPYYGKGSSTTSVYYNDAIAALNAQGANITAADYFTYYKYMYMTQGQHLAKEASRLSAQTASNSDEVDKGFAKWLQKHRSADGQYGAVKGENNAVQKEIVLDPLYRSLHTTGLYLPAGEPVTIKVEGLKQGERISVVLGDNNNLAWRGGIPAAASSDIATLTGGSYTQVNYDNASSDYFFKQADLITTAGKFFNYNKGDSTPFLQSQWKRQNGRAPWLSCEFYFTENKTYTIGFAYGGLIQIRMDSCYSKVKTTITGAVETPHYILGVTSPDYFDKYLKDAPGVMAVLDTENGLLTGPTGELDNPRCAYMRTVKKEEIDKLAMLWHSFISVNESFTGGTYNRFNRINFDWHVPAGAAVALGGYSFAMPTSWFGGAMNYQGLLKSGTWGTLHEIGHNHASAYGVTWGFGTGQEGEVRNNALTLLGYIMFCDVGTTIRMGGNAEHGMYANPYRVVNETITNKGKMTDFNEAGYWRALGMYANIMHSFGAEKYYELLYTYKTHPSYIEVDTSSFSTEKRALTKRADFAYRCSVVYGMNFLTYFNDFYAANITDDMFTLEQLTAMRKLPNYHPVSCFYAGGIDGVKTAGDYLVTFGEDITFDLMNNTISTLDSSKEKGFKIVSVESPKHGSIKKSKDGTYTYSFNKNYVGATDEFSFKVKMNDKTIHQLTIYLRISYNSAQINQYTGLTAPAENVYDELALQIADKKPQSSATATSASVPTYRSGELEVHTVDLWWKAPVTGEVALMVGGKGVRLYAGKDFKQLEGTNMIFSNEFNHNKVTNLTAPTYKHVMKVQKGKYYALRALCTNNNALNSNVYANIYVLQKDGQVVSAEQMDDNAFSQLTADGARYALIPTSQIFHPAYPLEKTYETYNFEPKFIVSQKHNVNLSVTGTDKSQWEVISAPKDIHNGIENPEGTPGRHYEDHIQYLIPVDENGNEIPGAEREEYIIKYNQWNYLIDGEDGTHLHTAYNGKYTPLSETTPHEFVIDMKRLQDINFFSVTTRNNANSYIEKFEFFIAEKQNADGTFEWHKVTEGDRSNYVGNKIMLRFEEQKARYLKLVVKKSSGGKFSVLSEIDAGIYAPTQQLVSISSSKLFKTKAWQLSSTIDTEPNGYIIANKKNAKAVVRFKGESVSLYAATDKGYGEIKVKIDGKTYSTVSLDREQADSRTLVFYAEDLSNSEHTMEIITTNGGKVMLNVIGIPYSASLLNAPNIYLEKALTISLIVFVLLFAAFLALLLCLLFIPKFRKFMGDNKAIAWLDKRIANDQAKRKAKRAEKKAKAAGNKGEKTVKNPTKNMAKQADKKTEKTAIKQEKNVAKQEKAVTVKNTTSGKNGAAKPTEKAAKEKPFQTQAAKAPSKAPATAPKTQPAKTATKTTQTASKTTQTASKTVTQKTPPKQNSAKPSTPKTITKAATKPSTKNKVGTKK